MKKKGVTLPQVGIEVNKKATLLSSYGSCHTAMKIGDLVAPAPELRQTLCMPVLNEDTVRLVNAVDDVDDLYNECFRLAFESLQRNWRYQLGLWSTNRLSSLVRQDLVVAVCTSVLMSDDEDVVQALQDASIDWRDVAREFVADVLGSLDAI
jgi:hypothetical protein